MGFLKQIVGAFVEVTPDDKKVTKPPDNQPAQRTYDNYTVTPPATSTSTNSDYTEFVKGIMDELKEKSTGNDYFTFKQLKDAMPIPQESVLYTAAFSAWNVSAKSGKEGLLKSLYSYVNTLNVDIVTAFENEYKAQFDAQVGNIKSDIEKKTAEVDDLQRRLDLLKSDISSLTTAMHEKTVNLDSKRVAFTSASDTVKQNLQNEINKINTLIIS